MTPLKLNVLTPKGQIGQVPLHSRPTFVVGSAPEAQVTLRGEGIASAHVRLAPNQLGYIAQDLSGVGFLLDGQVTQLGQLKEGGRIQLGPYTLELLPDYGATFVDAPLVPAPVAKVTSESAIPSVPAAAAAAAVTVAELVVLRGADVGTAYPLYDGTVILGRTSDIVIVDKRASRRHAQIDGQDGVFLLHDMHSSNGTTVNKEKITVHALVHGDLIGIGHTVLQFKITR